MKESWSYTEERLLLTAGSMGQLLTQLRPHISARLINGQGWERVVARAHETPATMGAFPFGFEIPLHDPEPRADFGVTLVGGSRTAALYQERCAATDNDPAAALVWLLDQTEREDSLLRRVVGSKMLLEYDIDPGADDARPRPGIFLYPVDDVLAGGAGRLRELGAVHDALVFAGGWDPDAAERQQLARVYATLTPDTIIKALGTFPERQRTLRIAVTGFKRAGDVTAFLQRNGWPGQPAAVGEVVSFFAERNAFAYLGLHFDVTAAGVGAALGLSFFAQEKEWLKDIEPWRAVIDGSGACGYALPEKLAELTSWSTGSATLFAKGGPIMLVRGIHHLKFVMAADQVEQVKAYIFFLLMCTRPDTLTSLSPTSKIPGHR
ncbi:MAG: hypothetical protein OXD47_03505 [Gammaproteobacteria bacterium]|nr:hypothetical protein [Gammaproteobacteria bacterium]MCY4211867.1 hypothetical protein [Gammaproteobacteria bacterium]MCY4337847.1 hypothetical protein [Gammaproteobacteria bacterium]